MRRNETSAVLIRLGPALLLFLLFFVIPLGYLVVYSFSKYDPFRLVVPTFTLENYARFFSDKYAIAVLVRTFRVAVLTSLVTLVVGYPLAYYMKFSRGMEKAILTMIILMPSMISHVILGYAWMVLIAPNSGLFSKGLLDLGFISKPLQLMNTEAGIVIGLTHLTLVYMVLNLHAALETIDPVHLRAAAVLGAAPWQTFLKVVLPLSLPGIFSGFLLVFAASTSAVMVPLMLGGRTAAMLSIYTYDLNTVVLNWPLGAVAGVTLVVISSLSTFILSSIVRRLHMRLGTR